MFNLTQTPSLVNETFRQFASRRVVNGLIDCLQQTKIFCYNRVTAEPLQAVNPRLRREVIIVVEVLLDLIVGVASNALGGVIAYYIIKKLF